MKIVASLSSDSMGTGSSAKPHLRLYITVATAVFQPIIIYWLTSHLVRWPWGVSKAEFPKEREEKQEKTFEYLYTCVYKVFFLKSTIWTVVNCSVPSLLPTTGAKSVSPWDCYILLWETWINSIFGHLTLTKMGLSMCNLFFRSSLSFIFMRYIWMDYT